LGVDIALVPGTGAAGRIMHSDVESYRAAHPAAAPTEHLARFESPHCEPKEASSEIATPKDVSIPVIGLRRKIAMKMQESKRRIPHFTYVEEVDVTELENLRERLNSQWSGKRERLTILPLLSRALMLAVRQFPQMNARFDDDSGVVTRHGAVHLGIATQTDNGLMVPVLRDAHNLGLWSVATEILRVSQAARSGRATREELSGSTITITSLGPLGGIVTTPVINHPEVAIIGVNRIVERPIVLRGAIVVRKMMNLSSSFDHRVIDGLDAANFVQVIRGHLETPATLFIA
jgi:2-oxoisovalerate dehydrogenase E2 component (dihydrolipoyl transacylase)